MSRYIFIAHPLDYGDRMATSPWAVEAHELVKDFGGSSGW
jgi:hypothetical protein